MKVAPVSQDLKDKFQLGADQKGVVITDVAPNTPASDRGLKPGDVIVEVQQTEVTAPSDIQKQVDAARKADRKNVLMLIQREGGVQYVPLAVTKDKG
jgi:serine protease Do